ncbi:MAG: hypothetical protein KDA60_20325 [Planctomycetales bacterium]|nr:hypothetical protein [Planctomycetales bacterium]
MPAHWEYFFDRSNLERTMDRKKKRVLIRTASYGRTVMQRGFKKRKGPAANGENPHSHEPHILRKLTLWGYEAAIEAVTIGPAIFKSAAKQQSKPVPQLLNEGGVAVRTVKKKGRRRKQRARYKARPFRDRALEPTATKMAELMKDIPL